MSQFRVLQAVRADKGTDLWTGWSAWFLSPDSSSRVSIVYKVEQLPRAALVWTTKEDIWSVSMNELL